MSEDKAIHTLYERIGHLLCEQPYGELGRYLTYYAEDRLYLVFDLWYHGFYLVEAKSPRDAIEKVNCDQLTYLPKGERVMRECSEHEITIEKLLNVVHSYTDPIRIQVIIGDAWLTCEEARGTRRLHDFYLTKAYTKYDDEEKERLLKYYKDVPVWNITAWHDVDCREIRYGIEARCHYKDVREGYLAEKADRKRAKERERRKKKREQTEREGE